MSYFPSLTLPSSIPHCLLTLSVFFLDQLYNFRASSRSHSQEQVRINYLDGLWRLIRIKFSYLGPNAFLQKHVLSVLYYLYQCSLLMKKSTFLSIPVVYIISTLTFPCAENLWDNISLYCDTRVLCTLVVRGFLNKVVRDLPNQD